MKTRILTPLIALSLAFAPGEAIGAIRCLELLSPVNQLARVVQPKDLRRFNFESFDAARTAYATTSEALKVPRSLEEKLALFTVLASREHREFDIKTSWARLSALDKVRMRSALQGLFDPRGISNERLSVIVQKLYETLFEKFHSEISQNLTRSEMDALAWVTKVRLTQIRVSKVLNELGLIRDAQGFEKFVFGDLRGQGFSASLNLSLNSIAIGQAMKGAVLPSLAFVRLPKINALSWIEIPPEMLNRALVEGLDPVWTKEIGPFLSQKYGSLARAQVIYEWTRLAWVNVTTAYLTAFVAIVVFEQGKAVYDQYRIRRMIERGRASQDPHHRALADSREKERLWEECLQAHPEAQDTSSSAYRLYHRVIFGY